MPTGYTAELVENGQTFEQFALTCARAFGALIEMRDDPLGTPIPDEFKPSDYYAKALKESQDHFAILSSMTPDQQEAHGIKLKLDAISRYAAGKAKDQDQNRRIHSMLNEVSRWTPPTSDHEGMRDFMKQQLTISLNTGSYYEKALAEANAKTPMEFYREALADALTQVERREESIKEEAARVAQRNDWVKALRESLKPKS